MARWLSCQSAMANTSTTRPAPQHAERAGTQQEPAQPDDGGDTWQQQQGAGAHRHDAEADEHVDQDLPRLALAELREAVMLHRGDRAVGAQLGQVQRDLHDAQPWETKFAVYFSLVHY